MIAGSLLATGGILLQQCWKPLQPRLAEFIHGGPIHTYLIQHPNKFPINGQVEGFIVMCVAILLYITVSLLTHKTDFDMDRMLHRGRYDTEARVGTPLETPRKRFTWGTLLGIDREFSFGDKLISISLFSWNMFWFLAFVVGCVWYFWRPWSLETWGRYWFMYSFVLPLFIGTITTVWLTWGGVRDLRRLFRDLRTCERSALDDGMVIDHRNLDEVAKEARNQKTRSPSQAVVGKD
jgi:SSS family solute:Na+ symporter